MKKHINGIEILHFDELDSTNKTALMTGGEHLSVVLADGQSGGRGRLGRSFFSPDGGLYMSVSLDPERIACSVSFLTASAAVAVRDTLASWGVSGLCIKWVNDILMNGKKVCGLLTEAQTENGAIARVCVGIGINLREPHGGFPEDIRARAPAIGFEGDKLSLAAAIAARLGELISLNKSEIRKLYSRDLFGQGERAEVTDYANGQKKVIGTVLGVDENCFLRILTDDGEERRIASGEISNFAHLPTCPRINKDKTNH